MINGSFFSFGEFLQTEVRSCLISLCDSIGHTNCQIIGDGITDDLISQIFSLTDKKQLAFKPIICVSFQGYSTNTDLGSLYPFVQFIMPTFTYKEMLSAAVSGAMPYSQSVLDEISSKQLTNEEQINSNVTYSKTFEMMFYYFGGCMRFHCIQYDTSISLLDKSITGVKNYVNILQTNVEHASASNTLVAVEVNERYTKVIRTSYLSKYVTKSISETFVEQEALSNFFSSVRNIKLTNPAFQGWVTEFELITKLQNSAKEGEKAVVMAYAHDIHMKIRFDVKNVSEFERDNLPQNNPPGTLLVPASWNYPTYDIAFVESETKIKFLQVTESKRAHGYDVNVLYEDAKAFLPECKVVEFCIVHRSNPILEVPSINNAKIQQAWHSLFTIHNTRSSRGNYSSAINSNVHQITLESSRMIF